MDESSLFPGFGRPDDHDRTDERTRGTRRKRQPGEAKACAEEAAKHAAAPLGCEAPATDAGGGSVSSDIAAAIEVAAATVSVGSVAGALQHRVTALPPRAHGPRHS